jgi:aspartyl-tRNA(Asn)/glutamyl-tRNA(Gln) amidotransferase subunit C
MTARFHSLPLPLIDRDEVRRIAALARLRVADEDLDRIAADMSAIIGHVSKIQELNLDGVTPTTHPLALVNVLGDDEPHASLSVEEALVNAPEREGDAFRVPA